MSDYWTGFVGGSAVGAACIVAVGLITTIVADWWHRR